jgi:hypothetical protein
VRHILYIFSRSFCGESWDLTHLFEPIILLESVTLLKLAHGAESDATHNLTAGLNVAWMRVSEMELAAGQLWNFFP